MERRVMTMRDIRLGFVTLTDEERESIRRRVVPILAAPAGRREASGKEGYTPPTEPHAKSPAGRRDLEGESCVLRDQAPVQFLNGSPTGDG